MGRKAKFTHGNGGDTVLTCETCLHPIAKGGIGWVVVDPIAATKRGADWLAGNKRPEVPWHIYHGNEKCDPHLNAWPSRPEFHVFACEIETIELLLLKTIELGDRDWLCDTNWHAIVKRIVFDSRHYADKSKAHGDSISETRKRNGLVGIGQMKKEENAGEIVKAG